LYEDAVEAFGGSTAAEEAKWFPLCGTLADPSKFAEKAAVVKAAQRDVGLLRDQCKVDIIASEVTGHFMRRSGAKALARRGFSLSRIQYFGRWGGPTVMIYVEEALDESAELRGAEASWEEVKLEMAKLVREAQRFGGPLAGPDTGHQSMLQLMDAAAGSKRKRAASGVTDVGLQALRDHVMQSDLLSRSTARMAAELQSLIKPAAVINRETASAHAVAPRFGLTPWHWKTACGWRWPRSPAAEPVTEDTPLAGISVCGRCQRYFAMNKLPGNVAALVTASRSELQ
jgi:hypothetical protein